MSVWKFVKRNTVLCVAALAAVITCFFVPPSKEYLGYFDLKTLACLFLTLAVICALKDIKFFTILARKIVRLTGNLRVLALALIYITFIGSMLIANDMALITFLPLGFFALQVTHNEKHMAYVFILQNIAANLGGMLKNKEMMYVRKDSMERMGAAYMANGIVTLAGSRLYTSLADTPEIIDDALNRFEEVFRHVKKTDKGMLK